jgi:hypothetical protein
MTKVTNKTLNKERNMKGVYYYNANKEKVLFNRRIDRDLKRVSKEFSFIMKYKDMLEALRYIKKTYYVVE